MILEQYHQVRGDLSEEWQVIVAQDKGYVYLQNVNSHLIADDYLFSSNDMSAVIQWIFNGKGTDNQQWQLRPVPGLLHSLVHNDSQVERASTAQFFEPPKERETEDYISGRFG